MEPLCHVHVNTIDYSTRAGPTLGRPAARDYLVYRSESCAPKTVLTILSKLAHKSIAYNHVLPLQKHDQPTILHKQVKRMVRELQLQYAQHAVTKLKGSSPLGCLSMTAMLRMFTVTSESSFNRLPRACRHHIAVSAMQHTAGLRFGHFIFRLYRKIDLTWNRLGAKLLTNWQRYPGKTCAAIVFPFKPRWQCFEYKHSCGSITAADLLQWHVNTLTETQLLFEPVPGRKADRGDRQRWLRAVFAKCFVVPPRATDALTTITPHSFRGGMAVDMMQEGASLEQIAARGRWLSRRAVKLYAGKCALGTICPQVLLPPFSPTQINRFDDVAISRSVRR